MANPDRYLTEKDLQEEDGDYMGFSSPSLQNDEEDPDGYLSNVGDELGDPFEQDLWKGPPPLRRTESFRVSGVSNASRESRDRTRSGSVTHDGSRLWQSAFIGRLP